MGFAPITLAVTVLCSPIWTYEVCVFFVLYSLKACVTKAFNFFFVSLSCFFFLLRPIVKVSYKFCWMLPTLSSSRVGTRCLFQLSFIFGSRGRTWTDTPYGTGFWNQRVCHSTTRPWKTLYASTKDVKWTFVLVCYLLHYKEGFAPSLPDLLYVYLTAFEANKNGRLGGIWTHTRLSTRTSI